MDKYAIVALNERNGELEVRTHWLSEEKIERYRSKPYWSSDIAYIVKLEEILPKAKEQA